MNRRLLRATGVAFTFALLAAIQPGGLALEKAVSAAATHYPWTPNSNYSNGFKDTWDYSDDPTGSQGEYGIDVPLGAGTSIYAPEAGTIVAYVPCGTLTPPCWYPGRMIMRLDSGAVTAFGHVNRVAAVNTKVAVGARIATVGDQGTNSHVEFMYSMTGFYSSRGYFMPPAGIARSSCPRNNWNTTGYYSLDPCVVLTGYMKGYSPRTYCTTGSAVTLGSKRIPVVTFGGYTTYLDIWLLKYVQGSSWCFMTKFQVEDGAAATFNMNVSYWCGTGARHNYIASGSASSYTVASGAVPTCSGVHVDDAWGSRGTSIKVYGQTFDYYSSFSTYVKYP